MKEPTFVRALAQKLEIPQTTLRQRVQGCIKANIIEEQTKTGKSGKMIKLLHFRDLKLDIQTLSSLLKEEFEDHQNTLPQT